MRIYRDHSDIPAEARGASAALGNFDGLHLGHQGVIDLARCPGAPLAVITFEPHPREVFAPEAPPFRLMSPAAKASRLAKLGVDILFELPFERIAPLSAEAFMSDVLADALDLSHVVVGRDFRFGKGRSGDADLLRAGGARHGFEVTLASLIGGEAPVSSTAIRAALTQGRPRDAGRMLGHWHRIEGPVLHGEKRGRDLGYPTANLSVDGLHLPKLGVYAVIVDILDGPHAGRRHGVASLGVRPMFGENAPNLETHLFDFAGDLYGVPISVALVEYLRPEQSFDGLAALIAQMDADSAQARAVLDAL
ncbi:bifunctional riboflavin kinase/FAD synthetase [Jannaschia sp. S6380]|uniref:bifunctional riboflavin kinase/FAD synthetase n=1 Tax=Jannaschia sp. S6380 TaxID=2926408 RepID=UPI001FF640FA|nr:bifunctional riboflavin kinase/FAD synthetase [Jannaschia sp. S6380]MCK0167580.1 bifunctional riboflavin kinase/FAD synthetase [Jannaschia sp. S6380]